MAAIAVFCLGAYNCYIGDMEAHVGRVISVRLRDRESWELERLAHTMGRSLGETAGLLLREKIREEAFPHIEFRASQAGRQATVKGTRLRVWQVAMVARDLGGSAEAVAAHLEQPLALIEAALVYADAYAEEIEAELKYIDSVTFEDLRRQLPSLTRSGAR